MDLDVSICVFFMLYKKVNVFQLPIFYTMNHRKRKVDLGAMNNMYMKQKPTPDWIRVHISTVDEKIAIKF